MIRPVLPSNVFDAYRSLQVWRSRPACLSLLHSSGERLPRETRKTLQDFVNEELACSWVYEASVSGPLRYAGFIQEAPPRLAGDELLPYLESLGPRTDDLVRARPELHEARDLGDADGLANRALCLLWFAEEILASDSGAREAQAARSLAVAQAGEARTLVETLLERSTLGEPRRRWALELHKVLRELDELDDPVIAHQRAATVGALFKRIDSPQPKPPLWRTSDEMVRAMPPRARELLALIAAAPRDPEATVDLQIARRLEFAEAIQDYAAEWSFYIRLSYARGLHPDYVRAVFPPALHPENIDKLPRDSLTAPDVGCGRWIVGDYEEVFDAGGFIYRIKLTVDQLIADIDAIFTRAPVIELRLEGDLTGEAGRILEHPLLHQLRKLHHVGRLDDAAVQRLLQLPCPRLEELFLSEGTPAHILAIAGAAASFPKLTATHFGASQELFSGFKVKGCIATIYGDGEYDDVHWERSEAGERLYLELGKPKWFPQTPYHFKNGPRPDELPDYDTRRK